MEKVKSTLILCYGYVARYAPKELVLARIDADILRNIFLYFNTKVRLATALPCLPAKEDGASHWTRIAVGAAGRGAQGVGVSRQPSALGLTPVSFHFVQVLGIKVETKVQRKALHSHSALLLAWCSVLALCGRG